MVSCVKVDKRWVELPALSANGSNYLAFYLNGEPYIFEGKCKRGIGFFSLPQRPCVDYDLIDTSTEKIICLYGDGGDMLEDVTMKITVPERTGIFDINELDDKNKFSIESELMTGYVLDKTKPNFIEIRKLTDTIGAGTFEIQLINTSGGKLQLEEGRFDIVN